MGVFMKSKFIAMVLTAIGLASFSLSSCTSSTPKEEDYYDPEHKPFGKYDEVVKVKGVMEFLAHNDSRVPSDITPETNVFIRKLKERASRELVKDIFSALYDLNPSWYEAVTITYVLEKPQKEVAEIMGVKLETLHSMLYRAKKWIRKHFEEQFDHLNKA